MQELTVRKAGEADKEAVMGFYSDMIDMMAGTDFDIYWKHDVHPSREFLMESVDDGYLYIGTVEENGAERIVCGCVVNREDAPGYDEVPWELNVKPGEFGVVHVVVTHPEYHGNGFAKKLMQTVIDDARAQGLKSLHLDTLLENYRAHGLYEGIGFVNRGAFPIYYADLGTVDLDMFEYVL